MSAIVLGMAATFQEGNARLLRLADFLMTSVPGIRFDYGSWVGSDWKGKPDLSCGTTACALGWGTTMPELRELGLRLFKRSAQQHSVNSSFPLMFVGQRYREAIGAYDPGVAIDMWNEACLACAEIFAVDEDETMLLFSPADCDEESYKPGPQAHPADVAKHIRMVVAERQALGGSVEIFDYASKYRGSFALD